MDFFAVDGGKPAVSLDLHLGTTRSSSMKLSIIIIYSSRSQFGHFPCQFGVVYR